jgi:phage terminase small subunit
MADFKRTKEYRELKQALLDHLAVKGLTNPVYGDMVRRYLSFREMEHQADADIAEKGLNIWDEKRQSWQINPCVSAKMNASRQAAAIYRALGFEDAAKNALPAGDDDDEL